MKKTQILSAIALAFALGVVAPIAVAENASAVTEATESADGTATVAEANAFKASVEGSKQYKALATLEAVKTPTVTVEANAATAIVNAYNDGAITEASDNLNANATLNEAAQAATKLGKYNAYAQAVHAIADAAKNGEAATFNSLKTAYKAITGKDYTGADYTDTASLTALQNAVTGTDDYTEWKALVDATDDGLELLQAVKDLKAALTTVNSDVEIVRDLANMDTYAKLSAAKTTVMGSDQGTAYTTLKAAFATFNTLKDATEADRKATYTALKNQVNNVEKLYNKADNSLTVSAIVAGYVAPVNPAEPGDGKDDVNAPATGIAGTAEGTATTVSIVAGLATALTALGAGVVAYRSARRK